MTRRRALIGCGLVSSLLYVATDLLLAWSYEGYSYTDQWVSELIASGSPTRSLSIALLTPYNLLVAGFGLGVWLSAGHKRTALITGAALAASAATGELTMLLFPMDQRGMPATLPGNLHGPLTFVMSVFTLLAVGYGASLLGRQWRWYSYLTIVALIVFGIWTSLYLARLEANEPTPWMGTIERVSIYAQMLWIGVLAVSLWRLPAPAATTAPARAVASPRRAPL
jgi:hypothetical protein